VLKKQVLERMILDNAQLQLARESGVRVDDISVNSAIARMADVNHMTMQELRAQVERDGEDFNNFREDMRSEITMVRLRDHEVESKIQVSEGEIDNLLAEQNGEAAEKVEYDVAQILLELPEIASPERVDTVHRRAEELAAQAKPAPILRSWRPAIPTLRKPCKAETSDGGRPSGCPPCFWRPSRI